MCFPTVGLFSLRHFNLSPVVHQRIDRSQVGLRIDRDQIGYLDAFARLVESAESAQGLLVCACCGELLCDDQRDADEGGSESMPLSQCSAHSTITSWMPSDD